MLIRLLRGSGKGSDVKASKDHDVDKRAYGHGRALLDKIEL